MSLISETARQQGIQVEREESRTERIRSPVAASLSLHRLLIGILGYISLHQPLLVTVSLAVTLPHLQEDCCRRGTGVRDESPAVDIKWEVKWIERSEAALQLPDSSHRNDLRTFYPLFFVCFFSLLSSAACVPILSPSLSLSPTQEGRQRNSLFAYCLPDRLAWWQGNLCGANTRSVLHLNDVRRSCASFSLSSFHSRTDSTCGLTLTLTLSGIHD